MDEVKLINEKNPLDNAPNQIAEIPQDLFPSTELLLSEIRQYLNHVREVIPNPTLLDRHLSNLNRLVTAFNKINQADSIRIKRR